MYLVLLCRQCYEVQCVNNKPGSPFAVRATAANAQRKSSALHSTVYECQWKLETRSCSQGNCYANSATSSVIVTITDR